MVINCGDESTMIYQSGGLSGVGGGVHPTLYYVAQQNKGQLFKYLLEEERKENI